MNLIGQTFGRLTVIDNAPSSPNRHKQVLCKCECSNQKVVRVEALLNGRTKNCGCLTKTAINFILFHLVNSNGNLKTLQKSL